jgi:hypothetical protein
MPMDAGKAVLFVVDIIGKSPNISELELVAALEREAFSHVHAEKLSVFVPSAFAWALLKRMGVQSFPSHYTAIDRFGKGVNLPIAKEQYFSAALQLACDTLEHGWSPVLTKEDFQRVVVRSAEYGTLDKALRAGKSVVGAKLAFLSLARISAEVADEK